MEGGRVSRVQMIEVDGKPVVEDDDMRHRQAVAMISTLTEIRLPLPPVGLAPVPD